MATGKVVAYAVVSVYDRGEGSDITVASGIELVGAGLDAWRQHGLPGLTPVASRQPAS
jgi:arginase